MELVPGKAFTCESSYQSIKLGIKLRRRNQKRLLMKDKFTFTIDRLDKNGSHCGSQAGNPERIGLRIQIVLIKRVYDYRTCTGGNRLEDRPEER